MGLLLGLRILSAFSLYPNVSHPLSQLSHMDHICMSCMIINTRHITINNYNYQSTEESHKWLQDLVIGDEVLVRVHLQRLSLGTLKKLHTWRRGPYKVLRRFGSNTYELDIFRDLGISLVFNIEDLTRYRTSTGSQWFSVRPLQPQLLRRSTTEELMQSFPVRLHHSHYRHLRAVNFLKPGRIDWNQ